MMSQAVLSADGAAWESRVAAAIGQPARLAVAFSGGVDSAVLTALAVRHLGSQRVLAVLGVSASLAAAERTAACNLARLIGVPLVELATRELDDAAYRANAPDRCFHCKTRLFTQIEDEITARYSIDAVAFGENADDARRIDRPGSAAATNHHVLRPLATAGLTKAMVRQLARELGLPVADKPASPCLASRIPHYQPVTADKLKQIDQAEQAVRDLGFAELRVRHHGPIARLELPEEDLPRTLSPDVRSLLVKAIRQAGFRHVVLDLDGLKSGVFTMEATREIGDD